MGLDGKPRQLHIAKALDVTNTALKGECSTPLTLDAGGAKIDMIKACPLFAAQRIRLADSCALNTNGDSFSILFCASGSLSVSTCDGAVTLEKGMAAVIPAAAHAFSLHGKAEAYRFFVPDIEKDIVQPLKAAGFPDEAIRPLLHR